MIKRKNNPTFVEQIESWGIKCPTSLSVSVQHHTKKLSAAVGKHYSPQSARALYGFLQGEPEAGNVPSVY